MIRLALGLCLLLAQPVIYARIPRSTAAVAEFKRANPCPLNGARRGPCHGFEVDHIQPLCAGGADTTGNMQWLTRDVHRAKTRLDVLRCRQMKRAAK